MTEFGELLRNWRKAKRFSQLDLGLEANVSAKHISFLETGRAQPSREMILSLANTLDVPLSERNALLKSAGFAEGFARMDFEQAEMAPVRKALDFMLLSHEPYPALVMDRDWNMLMANRPHLKLMEMIQANLPDFPDTKNVLELVFDPNGFRPLIVNWEEVACFLLQRLQRERIVYQQGRSPLLERLLAYPGIPDSWKSFSIIQGAQPVLSVQIQLGDLKLNVFSMLSSFGTAIDITTQELIIEHYYPVDEVTRIFYQQLQQEYCVPQVAMVEN